MDEFTHKTIEVSRGLKYHYTTSPAKQGKPTLLFCHGFPSTSSDWSVFATYFSRRGYGLIIPDMLGYGKTDKPTDVNLYIHSAMCRDMIDILDEESLAQVIAIGHDWYVREPLATVNNFILMLTPALRRGCFTVSRLASWFPERIRAYAFLCAPYMVPQPGSNIERFMAEVRALVGRDTFGYWYFFAEDDANDLMQRNVSTCFSLSSCSAEALLPA